MVNPQIFANVVKSKLNFNPIEIIGSEIISAGKASDNGSIVLVHCRLSPGGLMEFTVRGNNLASVDIVAT